MITKKQIKILHTLLSKLKLMDYKQNLIHTYSAGRTTSSKELTHDEAYNLISKLQNSNPQDKMRKKVFALAREMGMIWGYTKEDNKINAAKIDLFLLARGTVKKKLNDLLPSELIKVIGQFEKMSESTLDNQAKKAINQLLKDCNINQKNQLLKSISCKTKK